MKGHFLNSHFGELLHSSYPNIPKVTNHSCRFEIPPDQRSEIQTFHCPSGGSFEIKSTDDSILNDVSMKYPN